MLALLPLAAFGSIFLLIFNLPQQGDWRRACIRAAILSNAYLILQTEVLSLSRMITPVGLVFMWILPLAAATASLLRMARSGQRIQLPPWHIPASWGERTLIICLAAILAITAIVAWLTPPQTWDALNYHTARVAHWAQEGAVRHYITGIDVQNSMPPGAEMIALHFYVLAGSDRLVNFVSWLAMLGSLVAVSLAAQQLGAGRLGQLLAAVVCAAIPMGIVQASSAMNDYVVAFWCICLAVEALALWREPPGGRNIFWIGLAAGLALVTKPTAAAFIAPLGVFVAVALWRSFRQERHFLWWKKLGQYTLLALALIMMLNLGSWMRNIQTYGSPLGDRRRFTHHGNQLYTPAALISNVVRNAALHTGTPIGKINGAVYKLVLAMHDAIGLSVEDERTTAIGPYPVMRVRTNEIATGNSLHAGLILFSLGACLAGRKRIGKLALGYALTAAATFLLFSLLFKWLTFGGRLHMPFFVLFTPLIGYVLAVLLPGRWAVISGLLLAAASYPWLFSIETRPLIPDQNSLVGSVLSETRERLLFATGDYLERPYTEMIARVQAANCASIGIMLRGGQAEYPLWELMKAPARHQNPTLRIEWIVSGPTAKYEPKDFQACAVICEGCEGESWNTVRGLPLIYQFDAFRLYLQEDTNHDP